MLHDATDSADDVASIAIVVPGIVVRKKKGPGIAARGLGVGSSTEINRRVLIDCGAGVAFAFPIDNPNSCSIDPAPRPVVLTTAFSVAVGVFISVENFGVNAYAGHSFAASLSNARRIVDVISRYL